MHAAFPIIWDLVFGLIGCVFPFVAVCRGWRFLKSTLIAWIALVAFVVFSCTVLPLAISHLDPGFDGPFIFAMIVLGWIYPLISASLGYGSRQLWRRFYDRH
jgi:hypothetical protein